MKLYNTITRSVDEFTSQTPNQVKIYSCGPTVYDYAHVGHWFTYVRSDTLVRALTYLNYKVTWIMNITDVGHLTSDADEGEDKLEKGAAREGKTAWEVAQFYTEDFISGMKALNNQMPTRLVKATEHIEDQIKLIEQLEEKGYTYTISDGVYFDSAKFKSYADFARLNLEDLQAGARVNYNREKHNITDFALWKFSPKDSKRSMEWSSPWGTGFPGWHIECSAMSLKYLGPTLDIHSGGIDHVPLHHTNEIAQSEAATGEKFVNFWFHSNFVTINGEKISKSLGNGIRLQDLKDKGYDAEVLRLHILESHYRSQSKFTWESLEAARNRLRDYRAMAVLKWQPRDVTYDAATFALRDIPKEIAKFLAEDLNTPGALMFLSNVSTQLQAVHIEKDMVDHFEAMLKGIDDLLGLNLSNEPDITDQQKDLIAQREKYRLSSDWDNSDKIRDKLLEDGIMLNDHPRGVIWYRS